MQELNKIFLILKKQPEAVYGIDEQQCINTLSKELHIDEPTLKSELAILRSMRMIHYYPQGDKKVKLTPLGKETERIYSVLP